MKNIPHPIDVAVGRKIRAARVAVGMSQEKLGEALGLTFQQVQKYEKGTNRVAPSRLQIIANTLRQPISYFFAEDPAPDTGQSLCTQMLTTHQGVRLAKAFISIEDAAQRAALVSLGESIAGPRV